MAIEPVLPDYYPPPDEECEELNFPLEISSTLRISGHASMHRNRVVIFAMTIQTREPGEGWVNVNRVDCNHSNVHEHQFFRNGAAPKITKLCDIPTDGPIEDAWEVVDTRYEQAIRRFESDCDRYVRVWRGRG